MFKTKREYYNKAIDNFLIDRNTYGNYSIKSLKKIRLENNIIDEYDNDLIIGGMEDPYEVELIDHSIPDGKGRLQKFKIVEYMNTKNSEIKTEGKFEAVLLSEENKDDVIRGIKTIVNTIYENIYHIGLHIKIRIQGVTGLDDNSIKYSTYNNLINTIDDFISDKCNRYTDQPYTIINV